MKSLLIAWVRYQRRVDTMKSYWGYLIYYIPNIFSTRYLRPIDYIWKSVLTIFILIRQKPSILWIQLPPSILLHITFIYKTLFNPNLKIIVDFHNSMLHPQWIRFPLTLILINCCNAIVTHNVYAQADAKSCGIKEDKLYVLEDLPGKLTTTYEVEFAKGLHPYVVSPCSFDPDEPVDIVLSAALLMPDLTFCITGDKFKLRNIHVDTLPSNVKMPGYLDKSDFESLLCHADIVLGLTTRNNVQLSVANEAISAGVPMVLSDTKTLRSIYDDAAVFVNSLDPLSIANGLREVLQHHTELKSKVVKKKMSRITDWHNKAKLLEKVLTS